MRRYKSIILTFFVLVGIILTGKLIEIYLQKSTGILLEELKDVEVAITSEQWEDAQNRITYITEKWSNTSQRWNAFTNHHEIDNITISFKTTEEYIKNKEKSDSLTSLAALKHYIYHIPLMEKLTLENIF